MESLAAEILPRSGCTLSPSASAFSAILSAFIGSVINGLASGWLVAFMTGWIAWLAIFRVLLGGLYMLYRTATNTWGPGPGPGPGSDHRSEDALAPEASAAPLGDDTEASHHLMAPPAYNSNYALTGYSDPTYNNNNNNYHNNNYHNNYTPTGYPNPAYQNNHTTGYSNGPMWGAPPTHLPTGPGRSGILWSNMWPRAAMVRGLEQPAVSAAARVWAKNHPTLASSGPGATALDHSVTALGWFSWGYTALFAPVTQILFVAANSARHDIGATKIVKGLTVAVTALPLCIDCRVRYGDALGRAWRASVFNLATSFSALLQGGLCAVLLVEGLLDLKSASRGGFPVIIMAGVYPVFALFWMVASYSFLPMRDGGRKRAGQAHWAGYFLDVGAGAFAGIFLAAPAIALYSSAQFNKRAGLGFGEEPSSGLNDLGQYLSCESQWWRKFAAVSP
ncbi:hypothetical protein B0H67DRAFT_586169 [Lasiosphaeris hirsuta]|uniref:Uncharacterized protein n=1 Tax=Lasiosphaeris hirsuta TaxID=260670 RepID=A0AA40DSF0_9PEZI|nr:hypothetical protein B0H67DRAFT_586169 [Lasiosphaeris hirsuta]